MIFWILLSLILGLIVGAFCIYIVLRPKLTTVQRLDQETERKNNELQAEFDALRKETDNLVRRKYELRADLDDLIKHNEQSANAIYQACIDKMQEKLDNSAISISDKYQKIEEEAQSEYIQMLADSAENFLNEIQSKRKELKQVEQKLVEMQKLTAAAVEANRRAQEMSEKQDFYRLNLSEIDLKEIEKLREVAPYLRNSEPLNKVIWKVYYENPYTDLVGRVIGKGVHTGIYKITNIQNGMCYIGQSANLADRWKQHIKRGIGAETPTRNKLYPAMLATGVENFTFEVVEECGRDKLNEREDYWQQYFKAKEFGYSIK